MVNVTNTRMNPHSEAQNKAAGGEDFRKIRIADGTIVTASMESLKFPSGYQRWAYLRFKSGGKTTRKYIGKVSADSPDESRALAWRLVREIDMVGRFGWSWVSSQKTKLGK